LPTVPQLDDLAAEKEWLARLIRDDKTYRQIMDITGLGMDSLGNKLAEFWPNIEITGDGRPCMATLRRFLKEQQ